MKKGEITPQVTKEKIKLSRLRRKEVLGYLNSEKTRKKMSAAKIGKKHTEATKIKMGDAHRGKKYAFKKREPMKEGTKKKIREKRIKYFDRIGRKLRRASFHMTDSFYKIWRETVFVRDNYTCVVCGQVGEKLNADHIKKWADYPELRYEISNGRTLCVSCHRKTDTWGNKKP